MSARSADTQTMTDLSDLLEPLKREVAVPGTFTTVYPNTSDDDLVGSLMDAFAAAQLDGFFQTQDLDLTTNTVTPDLSQGAQALVTIYAAERILLVQIMNMRQRAVYEAGPVKYEIENSATVLTQILKLIAARRASLLVTAVGLQGGSSFAMVDAFADRLSGSPGSFVGAPYGTFYPYELIGY